MSLVPHTHYHISSGKIASQVEVHVVYRTPTDGLVVKLYSQRYYY